MDKQLNNKKVAVVVADGFEESEFTKPVEALRNAGAHVDVVSIKSGKVKAWSEKNWGKEYEVDKTIDAVKESDYDALVLPGGVMNPDQLRSNPDVVGFATDFMTSGKTVAAICHGPWTLVETGKLRGKKMTSYHSIKTDLINAGADWTDEEVVTDHGLVTSRKPADLDAFCKKMIEEIAEGKHPRR
jgi:protease I